MGIELLSIGERAIRINKYLYEPSQYIKEPLMSNHLFCFNVVGLSPRMLKRLTAMEHLSGIAPDCLTAGMIPVFPCLTLPGQASFFTGAYPSQHGIIANGFYNRSRFEVSFWDQYRSMVQAEPVWEKMKRRDPKIKTALLFCQNTLYGNADIIITPKPMHTDAGLVQWCYSKPVDCYEQVTENIGRPFNLMDYWGPFASANASEWIMAAARDIVIRHRPNFMATYIPHLDYSCQKYGPDDPCIDDDLQIIDNLIGTFINTLKESGILEKSTICLFSEYSLSPVTGAVALNRILRKNDFLSVRTIQGREYLDFEMSRAFAMVDHQVAHIYIRDPEDIDPVGRLLADTAGVAAVFGEKEKREMQINHERCGELVAVSEHDKWFTYYWWDSLETAPDFAENIDIHRKPGYDPVELFMNQETFKIPQSPELIKGSHGAPPTNGKGMAAVMLWGAGLENIELPDPVNMVDMTSVLDRILNSDHV
jgi:predicted AlkP superfamily pyrophosphatase or phosphodiesterase